jgi:hypothetical protein
MKLARSKTWHNIEYYAGYVTRLMSIGIHAKLAMLILDM